MSEFENLRPRVLRARPSTRKVLTATAVWLLVVAAITMVAAGVDLFAALGVHVDHPSWVVAVIHAAALLAGLGAGYFGLYLGPALSSGPGRSSALLMGAVGYALTLSALGWGVPAVSTLVWSHPTLVEAQVMGSSDLRRRRSLCRHRVYFGPWYATGGSVCTGGVIAGRLEGTVLVMEGHGNGWATRVSRIVRWQAR